MASYTVPFIFTVLILLNGCTQVTSTGGLAGGKLRPCPESPNCVSSESGSIRQIPPFSYTGTGEEAWQKVQLSITELGGEIITRDPTYIWSTFTSKVFRFVDDVELRLDREGKTIHIRSGSRLGYWDFGVNKKRIEKMRVLFSSY